VTLFEVERNNAIGLQRLICFTAFSAVLGGTTAGAVTAAKAYTNPKLSSGQISVTKVCMMPAEAELKKVGMKGTEGMSKESELWSAQLQGVVETELKDIGVTTASKGMSNAELQDNDDLRQTVLQIQEKFNSVAIQMERHAKDIKKSRYTLGDEVALLPCSAESDSLAFVQGQGSVLTGGKKAFGVLIGGQSASTGDLKITFVDAKSGDVLAYGHFLNNGNFEENPQAAYGKKLGKELKKIGIGPHEGKKK
jgi:hypothetical protein